MKRKRKKGSERKTAANSELAMKRLLANKVSLASQDFEMHVRLDTRQEVGQEVINQIKRSKSRM